MARAGVPADPLAGVLKRGGPRLAGLLARAEERLGAVAASHGEVLGASAGATLEAGGKRLRPLLVFLCGGEDGSEELVRAAVAVELVHMATLVHDDVLDGAALRRGRATVVATSGPGVAGATGDFLFSRAFAELRANGSGAQVAALADASLGLARGELWQRQDAFDPDVTEERYLQRCELKTGRLFQAACVLGTLAGDGPEGAARQVAAYGLKLGMAFQILDDVLDLAGSEEATGKRRGTDLLDGTVTLPLILALRERPTLRDALRRPPAAGELDAILTAVAATGAIPAARERALGLVAEAKALVRGHVGAAQLETLELVADGAVERYS